MNGNAPVRILTAPNPGPLTLAGTNTYLVGTDPGVVIDPGPDLPDHLGGLAGLVRDQRIRVEAILLTHGHPDHAPGAARLKSMIETPVWASRRMDAEAARQAGVDHRFTEGTFLAVDRYRLEAVSTPGHSPDHVAFWLPNEGALFSGDAILGTGTTLIAPPEGDMVEYMHSLEAMRALGPKTIYPGHGPVIADPDSKIEEYIQHRRQREAEVVAALRAGSASPDDLVRVIYTPIAPELVPLAALSVRAQLDKLMKEGRVKRVQGDRFRLTPQ